MNRPAQIALQSFLFASALIIFWNVIGEPPIARGDDAWWGTFAKIKHFFLSVPAALLLTLPFGAWLGYRRVVKPRSRARLLLLPLAVGFAHPLLTRGDPLLLFVYTHRPLFIWLSFTSFILFSVLLAEVVIHASRKRT